MAEAGVIIGINALTAILISSGNVARLWKRVSALNVVHGLVELAILCWEQTVVLEVQ